MRGAGDRREAGRRQRRGEPGAGAGRHQRVAIAGNDEGRLSDLADPGPQIHRGQQLERIRKALPRRLAARDELRAQLGDELARAFAALHLQRHEPLQRDS